MIELTLLCLDSVAAESLASDPDAFAGHHGLTLGPHTSTVAAIAAAFAQMLARISPPLPWAGYLALEGSLRRVVGTCGFKGGPDATGAVELAYFTFPGEEGRGIASVMAKALVQLARDARPAVRVVRAHTLPERNASCRVLETTGFQHVGSVIDPDDGPVWRWERSVGDDV